ncbi:GNAT family N-acetyltransferase [Oceanobacillus neutriphilus]|uniref:Spermidine/spermine N(1)-acetyltransferase n=1 Tax=Oceanobacillus neutriphilus TaxID=531815 RepID=A0ABQ2NRV8_9BACI|nr:GNAT family N-acetyltransferase [Oceanobacillus neutriphilus]GGP08695.1 spermidine/spermine N(1)-acetyltransferase [Oceanobacillus neutriphilus]
MLRLKKCTIDDIELLQQVSIDTFVDTFGPYNTEENTTLYINHSLSIESLTEQLNDKNSFFYFAFNHQELIGYVKLNTDSAQSKINIENIIEIERIYLLKDMQSKGLGQVILDKIVEIAKELNKAYIWLAVWKENKGAISFYEKNQFHQIDTINFPFGNDMQTGLVMKKVL